MEENHNINLREVLLGRPTRLRYVVRFAICPRRHDESVAEHSFYTAFFALMLARGIWDRQKVNLGVVLSRALVHDIDESYTGDFVRMFKHSSAGLKTAIDAACVTFMHQWAEAMSASGNGEDVFNIWNEAKTGDLEGRIVSFADFLSAASYIIQEIQAGNHSMYEHLEDLQKYYETFHHESYKFLEPYIEECGKILFAIEARRIQIK